MKFTFRQNNFKLLLPWQQEYALNIMAYYHNNGVVLVKYKICVKKTRPFYYRH